MNEEAMSIGRVAALAGVNIQTLRYYERRGLLASPERSAAGRRQFPAETVRLIRFIKRAQDLGFTLKEIGSRSFPSSVASASAGATRSTPL